MEMIEKKIATIGSVVEFKGGFKGRVEKLGENSVIVEVLHTPQGKEPFEKDRTVVNHRNYQIVD